MDNEGCPTVSEFDEMEFFIGNYYDKLEFKLMLATKSQSAGSFSRQDQSQLLKSQSSQELGEQSQRASEKELSRMDKLEQVQLCYGKLYLSDLVIPGAQRFYFIQELTEVQHHDNDTLRYLYEMVDRQNLYVLGSLEFQAQNWANIIICFNKIHGLKFNKQCKLYQQLISNQYGVGNQIIYFNLKSRIVLIKKEGTAKEGSENEVLAEQETEQLQFHMLHYLAGQEKYDASGISLRFTKRTILSQIYIENPDVESIVLEIELINRVNGVEQMICYRHYPIKRYLEPKFKGQNIKLNLELSDKDIYTMSGDLLLVLTADTHPVVDLSMVSIQDMKLGQKRQRQISRQAGEDRLNSSMQNQSLLESSKQNDLSGAKFDFRNQKLIELVGYLINTFDRKYVVQLLKEMHESFIYMEFEQYKEYFDTCLRTLIQMARLYTEDVEVIEQVY